MQNPHSRTASLIALAFVASSAWCQTTQPTQSSNANSPPSGQSKSVQVAIPADAKVEAAIYEALPLVKKVVAFHACAKSGASLRSLNTLAVPGQDISHDQYYWPIGQTRYHNKNECMRVQVLDGWTMPALNAMKFRVVYFADDSGEVVNWNYELRKADDGTWQIYSV